MDTATETLVIILSITLSIFLVVAIVLGIYVIKVVKTLQRLTDKAEALADKATVVGDFIGKSAGPLAVGRLVTHIADNVFSHGKKSKKESDDE